MRVPFRKWFTFQTAAGYSGFLNLVPSQLGDAIDEMRTSWLHWRLNHLHARISSGTLPVSVYNAGYVAGADCMLGLGFSAVDYTKFTSTPSWNSATQLPLFRMGAANQGCALRVQQRDLRKTTVPWLETTNTGSESEAFQSAGVLWHGNYVSTATTAGYLCHVILEGEVEFRDRADNSVTLFKRLLIAETSQEDKEEEKEWAVAASDEQGLPLTESTKLLRSVMKLVQSGQLSSKAVMQVLAGTDH